MEAPVARRRSRFAWVTWGIAVALVLAIFFSPPTTDARRVPKLTGDAAEALVADASSPLVLAFSVEGCHMCHGAIKLLRVVAREGPSQVRYAEVDLEEAQALGKRFGVTQVPTELVFENGRLVHRTAALETAGELSRVLAAR